MACEGQALPAILVVNALHIAVLQRIGRIDVERFDTRSRHRQPLFPFLKRGLKGILAETEKAASTLG